MSTTKPPATLSELFPSPWLHASDLNGRTIEVSIINVEFDEFPSNPMNPKSDKVWRAILDFGRTKKLILNKTQATDVSEIAGTETIANWRKTRISLRPAVATNGKATIKITPATPLPEIDADANELLFEGA